MVVRVKAKGKLDARRVAQHTSLGVVDVFSFHGRGVQTLTRGLVERLFGVVKDGQLSPVPQPTTDVSARLRAFKNKLRRHQPFGSCRSRQDFVSAYSGPKQRLYARAAASLVLVGISKRDARLTSFVKAEKLNLTLKPDPVPRVIQPRDPRYNVEVGRRLKFIEHGLYSAVARVFGDTTIAKGLNPRQRGALIKRKWDSFEDPVAVGLDASRFDQHVSQEMLAWEHSVYHSIFHDPELQRLLSWQLVNHGIGFCPDGLVKYSKRGTRGSGDMNTALGNCLIMCAMVYTFVTELGVQAKLINDGDDCVLFLDRRDLNRVMINVSPWFTEFGFTMTVEAPVYQLEHIEFCQCKPVNVGGTYVMIRKPRKALGGDTVSLKVKTLSDYADHCTAVGICGGVLSAGVPIYQDFYAAMRRVGSGNERRLRDAHYLGYGFTHMALQTDAKLRVRITPIAPETRVSFYHAFGIKPDQQLVAEHLYSSISELSEFTYSSYEGGWQADSVSPDVGKSGQLARSHWFSSVNTTLRWIARQHHL